MDEQKRIRLTQMLNADKEEMSEETKKTALTDLKRVLSEYFELEGELCFQMASAGGKTEVLLRFRAMRVKNFTSLK